MFEDLKRSSKCQKECLKFTFSKEISNKDRLNPFCKLCRKGSYIKKPLKKYLSVEKDIIIKKVRQISNSMKKIGRKIDLNFKLAHNIRCRISKVLESQIVKKLNKTFELLGNSHYFSRKWIFLSIL